MIAVPSARPFLHLHKKLWEGVGHGLGFYLLCRPARQPVTVSGMLAGDMTSPAQRLRVSLQHSAAAGSCSLWRPGPSLAGVCESQRRLQPGSWRRCTL